MRTCTICKAEFRSGGFVVIKEEVLDGASMLVIDADKVDPDFAGDGAVCGRPCIQVWFGRRLDDVQGIQPVFPVRRSAA